MHVNRTTTSQTKQHNKRASRTQTGSSSAPRRPAERAARQQGSKAARQQGSKAAKPFSVCVSESLNLLKFPPSFHAVLGHLSVI